MRALLSLLLIVAAGVLWGPVQAEGLKSMQPAASMTHAGHDTIRVQHRKARHAKRSRRHGICGIINGWRAFPVHARNGYFNTDRVRCHHYAGR